MPGLTMTVSVHVSELAQRALVNRLSRPTGWATRDDVLIREERACV